METTMQKFRIHPLFAGAAVAVIIASAVAVAAMTGHLPGSNAAPSTAQLAAVTPPPDVVPPVAIAPPPASPVPALPPVSAPTQELAQAPAPAPAPAVAQAPACPSCGVVRSVNAYQQKPDKSVIGMVGGGVVGALAGNAIGDGNAIATLGGAAGGAYLGNKVGQKVQTKTHYKVVVRMDGGKTRSFTYAQRPGFEAGSHVRVENGRLVQG